MLTNEIKVALAVLLSAAVIFVGVRFLSGQPLFGAGYDVVAVFDDAQGLTAGAIVRLNGVPRGRRPGGGPEPGRAPGARHDGHRRRRRDPARLDGPDVGAVGAGRGQRRDHAAAGGRGRAPAGGRRHARRRHDAGHLRPVRRRVQQPDGPGRHGAHRRRQHVHDVGRDPDQLRRRHPGGAGPAPVPHPGHDHAGAPGAGPDRPDAGQPGGRRRERLGGVGPRGPQRRGPLGRRRQRRGGDLGRGPRARRGQTPTPSRRPSTTSRPRSAAPTASWRRSTSSRATSRR